MKATRKIFAVLLALVMVFAMSASAFAINVGEAGSYVVGAATPTDTPIHVKVAIQTKQSQEGTSISEVLDVTVSTASNAEEGFTVRDAVLAIMNNEETGIKFYTMRGSDRVPFTSTSTYVESIEKDGILYAPALLIDDPEYAVDGLFVRVNDQLPLQRSSDSTNPTGASINETPISDGDIIFMYWSYPYPYHDEDGEVLYANPDFLAADTTYNAETKTLSAQIVGSYSYFENSGYWEIKPFEMYSKGGEAVICDVTGKQVASGTVDAGGALVINNVELITGDTYYIKVNTTSYQAFDGYTEDFDDIIWNILKTTMVYDKFVA